MCDMTILGHEHLKFLQRQIFSIQLQSAAVLWLFLIISIVVMDIAVPCHHESLLHLVI